MAYWTETFELWRRGCRPRNISCPSCHVFRASGAVGVGQGARALDGSSVRSNAPPPYSKSRARPVELGDRTENRKDNDSANSHYGRYFLYCKSSYFSEPCCVHCDRVELRSHPYHFSVKAYGAARENSLMNGVCFRTWCTWPATISSFTTCFISLTLDRGLTTSWRTASRIPSESMCT